MAPTTTTFTGAGPRVAAIRHPLYDALRATWVKLGHVREGTGGFLDGTYLTAHPREWLDHTSRVTTTDPDTGARVVTMAANPNPKKPSAKLKARRALAAYTNYADAILDSKKSGLFREPPTRRVGEGEGDDLTDLERWWDDVDGQGTDIDKAMRSWWDVAATFGHCLLYFELPSDGPDAKEGEVITAADAGLPVIRAYAPMDVINWLTDDDGRIISVKVVEAVQAKTYDDTYITQEQVRVIDQDGWAVYDYKSGTEVSKGVHGLGILPCVYLYGKRRATVPGVGQSILGDPQNHIDIYNLESERRELLRNQTFSVVNVPLGTGTDAMSVEQAQQMMGSQTGTMNVLFSPLAAQMLSGDAANVQAYQETIDAKVRAIYREAGASWESDSKDAEATGSLELKREELNTRLAQYADECQQAELSLADLFYRWVYGAERGPEKLVEDDVTIQYPDRFGMTPFDDVLAQVQSAQSIGMPALFLKALRKAIVSKFEGMASLSPSQMKEIMDAIDEAPDDPTPAERMQQRMELMDQASKVGAKPPAVPGDPSKV